MSWSFNLDPILQKEDLTPTQLIEFTKMFEMVQAETKVLYDHMNNFFSLWVVEFKKRYPDVQYSLIMPIAELAQKTHYAHTLAQIYRDLEQKGHNAEKFLQIAIDALLTNMKNSKAENQKESI